MLSACYRKALAVLLLLATLLGTLFILPTSAEEGGTVVITIPLDTPLSITLKAPPSSEEGKAELSAVLSSITQPVFDALIRDYPLDVMWVNISGCKLNFSYTTGQTPNTIVVKSMTYQIAVLPSYTDPKGMVDQVASVIDGFTVSGITLYEKVQSIHDFVCRMATYDATGDYLYSIYGSLVDRRSVCEGYAEAFKVLCEKNGIDCVLISGIAGSQNENHMWAYVRMDDNRWYAVDPTWDDGRGTAFDHRYFLIGSETVVLGSTAFSQSHTPLGDISHTGYHTYAYPELSVNSYLTNHPDGTADGDYPFGQSTEYFYHQLTSELQRTLYTSLLDSVKTKAPSHPEATPTPAPTDDLTTQAPTSELLPPVTTTEKESESTTSESESVTETESETTTEHESETVTETESETVTETESEHITETESETTTERESETVTETETETESETVTETESETETESLPPVTTDPITVPITPPMPDTDTTATTVPPTEPATTVTTAPLTDTTQSTVTEPTTDSGSVPPPSSDTRPPQSSSDTETGTVSITVTPPPTSTPQDKATVSLIEILRVGVIVVTLLTVFALVAIVIIKTQNHDPRK